MWESPLNLVINSNPHFCSHYGRDQLLMCLFSVFDTVHHQTFSRNSNNFQLILLFISLNESEDTIGWAFCCFPPVLIHSVRNLLCHLSSSVSSVKPVRQSVYIIVPLLHTTSLYSGIHLTSPAGAVAHLKKHFCKNEAWVRPSCLDLI